MKHMMSVVIVLILLSGCSSKPSVTLTSASVIVKTDETAQKVEGQKQYSLHYDFMLKNKGNKTLGSAANGDPTTFDYPEGIKLKIEPNGKLIDAAKEVTGFNIYDENERRRAHFGMGKTGVTVLKPNQEGKYTFDYLFSSNEQHSLSQEQLDKLVSHALNATLIISVGAEEIARFDLSNAH